MPSNEQYFNRIIIEIICFSNAYMYLMWIDVKEFWTDSRSYTPNAIMLPVDYAYSLEFWLLMHLELHERI